MNEKCTKDPTIKLIHEPEVLGKIDFGSASIKVLEESGVFSATIEVEFKGFDANTLIKKTKEIYAGHPEYIKNPQFYPVNTFTQYPVGFQEVGIHYLDSFESYKSWTNKSWERSYSHFPVSSWYEVQSLPLIRGEKELKLTFSLKPIRAGAKKEQLIEAVRALKVLFMEVTIMLEIPFSPVIGTLIYTNGGESYIEDSKGTIGLMPSSIYYLELRDWKGDDRKWTKKDLSYTGDCP